MASLPCFASLTTHAHTQQNPKSIDHQPPVSTFSKYLPACRGVSSQPVDRAVGFLTEDRGTAFQPEAEGGFKSRLAELPVNEGVGSHLAGGSRPDTCKGASFFLTHIFLFHPYTFPPPVRVIRSRPLQLQFDKPQLGRPFGVLFPARDTKHLVDLRVLLDQLGVHDASVLVHLASRFEKHLEDTDRWAVVEIDGRARVGILLGRRNVCRLSWPWARFLVG